jgi:hypothetical protein
MAHPIAEIEARQRASCEEYSVAFVSSPPELKTGFATSTKERTPINGLRHVPEIGTTGWYIWCGEGFSDAADFFAPVHTSLIYDDYPQIVSLMGLPPGHRFLVAGAYLDVWFDNSLLSV